MPQFSTVKWRVPPPGCATLKWRRRSSLTMSIVGAACKIWLEFLNRAKVYNKEVFQDLVEHRHPSVPLITVCNHDSCLDDPLLFGLLKMRHLANSERMRWALGGHDVMFTRELYNWFFSYGQVVPVVRGNGVYQKSMDFVLEQLNRGGWVHIFPEGKVNMTDEYLRLKWGVGRLIADSNITPVVLPIWHRGIVDILPNRSPYIPRIFKKVTVNIGKPMDFREVVQRMKDANKSPMEMRKAITDAIQEEFKSLREITDKLHAARFTEKKSDGQSKDNLKSSSVIDQSLAGAANISNNAEELLKKVKNILEWNAPFDKVSSDMCSDDQLQERNERSDNVISERSDDLRTDDLAVHTFSTGDHQRSCVNFDEDYSTGMHSSEIFDDVSRNANASVLPSSTEQEQKQERDQISQ